MSIESDPIFKPTKTAAPYRTKGVATGGSSAEGSSADRALREAGDGTLSARQVTILQLLAEAGPLGLTYAEIADATHSRGGAVTGALSVLHKAGLVAALKTDGIPNNSRNGCGIYVLPEPECIKGRIVRKFTGNQAKVADRPHLTDAEKELLATLKRNVRQGGDTIVRMYPTTARSLIAALERLDA
jgi:predicted RNA-binding protein YlxR (DUF448 family)